MHAVPGKALEGDELASTPGFKLLCPAYSGEIGNEESVRRIRLFHSYIGLAVIGRSLWVDNKHIGLVWHKRFAGGKKICDMDAVNRCRFQTGDNSIEVFMEPHAFSDHTGKFISTGLIIAK